MTTAVSDSVDPRGTPSNGHAAAPFKPRPCPFNLTRDELVAYTPEWDGERFDDGRPRVPDEMLERLRRVEVTQAWTILHFQGYSWQFEGGWRCTQPGGVLVGRALTAMYMPRRPDLRKVMDRVGEEAGGVGDQISWPIDRLTDRDVYVADVFGKVERGPIMGDNLATAIHSKSGNGVVHDAAIRDWNGVRQLPDFVSFCRGPHPTFASPTIMLSGINCPVRIGQATVMPGDAVLGKQDGVVFIPPHMVERVVVTSDIIRLRDRFGKQRIRESRYTSGQVDCEWTEAMERDFDCWLDDHLDDLPVSKSRMREYLKERTW
jgi:regulator of RNase E activity RraA